MHQNETTYDLLTVILLPLLREMSSRTLEHFVFGVETELYSGRTMTDATQPQPLVNCDNGTLFPFGVFLQVRDWVVAR